MKIKVLSVICSAILVFSLTGCGKEAGESSAHDADRSTSEAADNASDSASINGTFVKMIVIIPNFFTLV